MPRGYAEAILERIVEGKRNAERLQDIALGIEGVGPHTVAALCYRNGQLMWEVEELREMESRGIPFPEFRDNNEDTQAEKRVPF